MEWLKCSRSTQRFVCRICLKHWAPENLNLSFLYIDFYSLTGINVNKYERFLWEPWNEKYLNLGQKILYRQKLHFMNDKLNLRRSVRPSSLSRDSTMDDLCCYFCHFLCVFSIRLISAISHCKMKIYTAQQKACEISFWLSWDSLCPHPGFAWSAFVNTCSWSLGSYPRSPRRARRKSDSKLSVRIPNFGVDK